VCPWDWSNNNLPLLICYPPSLLISYASSPSLPPPLSCSFSSSLFHFAFIPPHPHPWRDAVPRHTTRMVTTPGTHLESKTRSWFYECVSHSSMTDRGMAPLPLLHFHISITYSSYKTWAAVVDPKDKGQSRRHLFLWLVYLAGLALEPIVDSAVANRYISIFLFSFVPSSQLSDL